MLYLNTTTKSTKCAALIYYKRLPITQRRLNTKPINYYTFYASSNSACSTCLHSTTMSKCEELRRILLWCFLFTIPDKIRNTSNSAYKTTNFMQLAFCFCNITELPYLLCRISSEYLYYVCIDTMLNIYKVVPNLNCKILENAYLRFIYPKAALIRFYIQWVFNFYCFIHWNPYGLWYMIELMRVLQ